MISFYLYPPYAHYHAPYTVPASGNEISDQVECPYKIPLALIKHDCIPEDWCICGDEKCQVWKELTGLQTTDFSGIN